jgi:hypothetical protein
MKNKYSENWKDSWDPEEWQGRSKKQVDYFHLIVGISLTVMIVYLLFQIILLKFMPILNSNIPSFKALVRKSFFTKNPEDFRNFIMSMFLDTIFEEKSLLFM